MWPSFQAFSNRLKLGTLQLSLKYRGNLLRRSCPEFSQAGETIRKSNPFNFEFFKQDKEAANNHDLSAAEEHTITLRPTVGILPIVSLPLPQNLQQMQQFRPPYFLALGEPRTDSWYFPHGTSVGCCSTHSWVLVGRDSATCTQ